MVPGFWSDRLKVPGLLLLAGWRPAVRAKYVAKPTDQHREKRTDELLKKLSPRHGGSKHGHHG
jgi:hypothetical protein